MSYWHHLTSADGLGDAFVPTLIAFFLIAFVVAARIPEARVWVRAAVVLMALALLALIVAGAMPGYTGEDLPTDTAFRWVRGAGVLLQGMALVTLAGVIFFDFALRLIRVRPPPIVRDLLMALAYGVVGALLLSRIGVNLAGIVATSAVVTAVIGFSLQDTLGNIMGGMALQLDSTIGPGDWIKIDDVVGVVKEIRWRQTTIETRTWDTVVIPNSHLMKSQVTILGRRTGRPRQHRVNIGFNVDFRYAPTKVIEAVESALRSDPIPGVATDPAPQVVMTEFRDSYAAYAVRYWLADLAHDEQTDTIIRTRIYFALKRADIPPSIPAYAAFNTNEDPQRHERKHARELARRFDALEKVDLFQPLTDDERRQLADRMTPAPFTAGEVICRQGDASDGLYCIIRGEAEVRVVVDTSSRNGSHGRLVATLHPGDFFGEMGLMTGEVRSATVVAVGEVECYHLASDAFLGILRHRPEIADGMSTILARRRVELDAIREHLNDEAKRGRVKSVQGDLLHKIRQFFKLER